jgi:uncharacterized protein YndB with AHSA1/START domain
MAAGNSIDLESDPRAIIATRVFDAPRDLVFAVWTDPAHLAQWWGPNGFTTTTHSFDMRAGGIWRFVMHGPDGRDYQNRITYEEVVRPERIVYRHGGGEDVEPVQFKTTVTFEDVGGGSNRKTRITMRGDFPSAAERDRVIKEYGADKGLVQTLARLEQHVSSTLNRDREDQSHSARGEKRA